MIQEVMTKLKKNFLRIKLKKRLKWLPDHTQSKNDESNEKPGFGDLAGCSRFALSKIQDFFENHNSYIIYLWHMIAKHQLISSSMNMLADGVGSCSGAREIPLEISTG